MRTAIAPRSIPARRAPASGLLIVLSMVLAHPAQAAESAADDKDHVAAVWKTQEIRFHYQSFTTYYTCEALEGRVTRVLAAMGMSRDLDVRAGGCESGRIAAMPFVRIRVTSPVEATAQALADLEATRSTRELAARVRGEALPDADQQFTARWQPVSVFKGRMRLDPADCGLVEQLQRYVFPKLAIRTVKDRLGCSPNQYPLGSVQLDVEVLTQVTPDAADTAAAPATQPTDKQP